MGEKIVPPAPPSPLLLHPLFHLQIWLDSCRRCNASLSMRSYTHSLVEGVSVFVGKRVHKVWKSVLHVIFILRSITPTLIDHTSPSHTCPWSWWCIFLCEGCPLCSTLVHFETDDNENNLWKLVRERTEKKSSIKVSMFVAGLLENILSWQHCMVSGLHEYVI